MEWIKKKNDPMLVENLMKKCKITELQANLLLNRGIVTEEEANKYLYGSLDDLYDPVLLTDMEKAVEIIINAIKENRKIVIYGDYDADGINATAVAVHALRNLGANVDYYIPHRVEEGYGMNKEAIRTLKEQETDLIITVDNGIASVEEVKLAKELEMQIIVTDHHDCPSVLPEPDALINPKRPKDKYPNKNLCGCGVIWKVMQYLYSKLNKNKEYLYDLLGFVAVATVADVMELRDENRILVKEGLKIINSHKLIGLSTLMDVLNIKEVTAEDIGFRMGPCLNADGRLHDAYKAVELLLSENIDKAMELAEYLVKVNEERKALTLEYFEKAEDYIRKNRLKNKRVIVVFEKTIPEGIVGLIASKVKEKYKVPTLVFTEGKDCYKGSGRGVEGYPLNMFDLVQKTRPFWIKGGGHEMACGISMKKDMKNLLAFSDKVNEIADELLKDKSFTPVLEIDAEIDIPDEKLCREIAILEPTGKGNPKPVFCTNSLQVVSAKPIGDGTHILFQFDGRRKGVAFGKTYLYQALGAPLKMKVAYYPVIDEYTFKNQQGELVTVRNVKMHIQDMQAVNVKNKVFLISSLKQSVNRI